MWFLDPQRLRELVLSHCLLSWAGQRAHIYLSYTRCSSLHFHIVPALAASFLVSFEARKERKGASNAWWGSTKDQSAPEDARLLRRALRPTTEDDVPKRLAPHALADTTYLVWPYTQHARAPTSPRSTAKSRIGPRVHTAGRQAGAIRPVRRTGFE